MTRKVWITMQLHAVQLFAPAKAATFGSTPQIQPARAKANHLRHRSRPKVLRLEAALLLMTLLPTPDMFISEVNTGSPFKPQHRRHTRCMSLA
mmetsp:Transcript_10575/g.20421  ORF Transcript_10575/g.20421 Transcript_10575/m.20421 type:complete len:93 (+) Transcript_10575:465-743(+)